MVQKKSNYPAGAEPVAIEPLAVGIKDACRITGLSRTSIYREISARRIVALKAGKKTLLPVASLRAWLASLPQSNAA